MDHRGLLNMDVLGNELEFQKNRRCIFNNILAITTGKGTGVIIDLNREGLTFGCLYPHKFPDSWSRDILGAGGSYIKELQVKKIWERKIGLQELSLKFELEVRVEFGGFMTLQQAEIACLFDNLVPTYM